MPKWVFTNTQTNASATLERGPSELSDFGGMSRDVAAVLFSGNEVTAKVSAMGLGNFNISGTALLMSDLRFFEIWFDLGVPVRVTDDIGNQFTVLFTRMSADRDDSAPATAKHRYTIEARVLSEAWA